MVRHAAFFSWSAVEAVLAVLGSLAALPPPHPAVLITRVSFLGPTDAEMMEP